MRHSYGDAEHGVTANLMLDFADEHVALLTGVETRVEFRGQGHASRLMKTVLEDADRELVTLLLAVEPDGSANCLDYGELVAWYGRLGFKFVDAEEDRTMCREV